MNTESSSHACACTDCQCEIREGHRVLRDGKEFCSEACASGHTTGEGCCDGQCHCHG